MDRKIKTETVKKYTATDGKSFVGTGSKDRAINYQKHLDILAKRVTFYKYMCGLFMPEFSGIDSLNEAVGSDIEHIADDAEDLADDIVDLFAFFGSARWMQINTFLTGKLAEKQKKTHNWTKETMGECAKIHMEDIVYWYYNLEDGEAKRQKLDQIIQSYANISNDLKK